MDRVALQVTVGAFLGTKLLKASVDTYEKEFSNYVPGPLVICDDGDFYADNTIQRKDVLVGNLIPWYLKDKKQ